jgi:hypothetical protein
MAGKHPAKNTGRDILCRRRAAATPPGKIQISFISEAYVRGADGTRFA